MFEALPGFVTIVALVFAGYYGGGFGLKKSDDELQERARKRVRHTGWVFMILGVVLFYPFVITGAFASDPGTSEALRTAYFLILTPVVMFFAPVVPRFLYGRKKYHAALTATRWLWVLPVLFFAGAFL